AEETFRSGALDWGARASPAGQRRLGLVRDLLTLRQREIMPYLAAARFEAAQHHERMLQARWSLGDGRTLLLLANPSDAATHRPEGLQPGRPIWGGKPASTLQPWAVFWSIGAS